jgi:hypothetical protein
MPSESEAAELAAAAEAEAADAARAAGAAGSGTPGGSGEQPPPAASAPQTVPLERFRAVIGQRAEREAQLLEARRQLELANATIEEFKKLSEGAAQAAAVAGQGTGGQAAPAKPAAAVKVPSAAEIEQLVAAEAARRDFTRQCNDAFAEGKKAHSDFEKVIADLNALSPVFDPRLQRTVMPQSLIEAALATGNAPEVLYALGKDNSLADRVLTMTPLQQAAELTKLSIKLEATSEESGGGRELPAVSRAPAPVRPKVTGTGGTPAPWDPADTEHFSTAEWIAKREADLKRKETRH